jgi:protocatechuate 3,4-dioxygenase beta subunit
VRKTYWLIVLVIWVLMVSCTGNGIPLTNTRIPPEIESPEISPVAEETETISSEEFTSTDPSSPTDVPSPTSDPAKESSQLLTPPPWDGMLTSRNMEGPYYTPGSPERASLIEAGMGGIPILIQGRVFNGDCQPLAGARVDFWQADADGVYDNTGYTLRGHVLSGEDGSYAIETIAPGLYPGRPAHIHVKVFAANGQELLTTQLYFPGSEDSHDVAAAPDLLVTYAGLDEQGRQLITFNFIVSQ